MQIKINTQTQPEEAKKIRLFPKKKTNPEKKPINKSTYKYLLYFLVFVLFCVILAIGIKAIILIKNSTFNSSSYSLLVNADKPFVLTLNKSSGNLSTIYLKSEKNGLKTSIDYSVPIDGEVLQAGDITPGQFLSFKSFGAQLLRPGLSGYVNLNSVDVLKFMNATFAVPAEQRKTYSLHLSKTGVVTGISTGEMFDVLKDADIVNEALSIEVINATSEDGLAGQVAQLIKNCGGNVVSVTSQDSTNSSSIESNVSSITTNRLSHLLQIPILQEKGSSTADIVIVLGEDFARKVR